MVHPTSFERFDFVCHSARFLSWKTCVYFCILLIFLCRCCRGQIEELSQMNYTRLVSFVDWPLLCHWEWLCLGSQPTAALLCLLRCKTILEFRLLEQRSSVPNHCAAFARYKSSPFIFSLFPLVFSVVIVLFDLSRRSKWVSWLPMEIRSRG